MIGSVNTGGGKDNSKGLTATADKILKGYTACVDGEVLTGVAEPIKKSLILPTNPTLTVKADDTTMLISWTKPTSEVAIAKYNVYYSTSSPSSLSSMTFKGSTTSTSYTLTGLTNERTYYVAVASVDANGYENASIWQVKNGVPTALRFVCVGKYDSYYSNDGITWTKGGKTNSEDYTYGITFGNGRYVCVGSQGFSYYSTNGKTWVAMSGLKTGNHFHGVTYGNGRFVCVGTNGYSYYSTDGTSWVAMPRIANGASYGYRSVIYGSDKFVCVGDAGKSYRFDGTMWASISGLNSNYIYYGVTYGSNKFVCVGNTKSYYSDGTNSWVAMSGLTTSTNYNGVTYGNGRFVCVGTNGYSYYSTDGTSWTAMTGIETSFDGMSVISSKWAS